MSQDNEEKVVEFVNRVLDLGGFDLKAVAEPADDGLKVQIRGGDVALLLARNAELLNAIEYISNRAFTRASESENKIIFDSGDYRMRREKELKLMACKAAEKVRLSGVPFSFDAMSPGERRIIHLALAGDETVKTESSGQGIDRKVTIYRA